MSRATEHSRRSFGKYRTALADPPWAFHNFSSERTGDFSFQRSSLQGLAQDRYPTMPVGAIADLPVAPLMARDATLLLWAVLTHLPEALYVMGRWGFTYKSAIVWVKMTRAAAPRVGLGYHVRHSCELMLIGTKGRPAVPKRGTQPLGVLFNPIGDHSVKPEAQYAIAEGYAGPYLELFGRPHRDGLFPPTREGWTVLGDAVDGRDIRAALEALAQTKEERP